MNVAEVEKNSFFHQIFFSSNSNQIDLLKINKKDKQLNFRITIPINCSIFKSNFSLSQSCRNHLNVNMRNKCETKYDQNVDFGLFEKWKIIPPFLFH